VALAATVPQGTISLPTELLVAAHAFYVGRWDRRPAGLAAAVVLVVVGEVGVLVAHDSAVPFLLLPIAAWAAGRALHDRDVVAERMSERALELDQEREAYAQLSVRYERARIAAELHDTVAHALSVMVVQASAGQRLAGVDPELTAEAFDVIAEAAHHAEQDISRLVALLADAGSAAAGRAPDFPRLEELVGRAAAGGLKVRCRLEGEREAFPAAVGQVAYRVVQEGMTNALRHASGASVDVIVRGRSDELLIEVINGPAGAERLLLGSGTGTGLIGLRERVGAVGGQLDVGPTPDGGWRLAARLGASD
jgi:signal transduction histidine kinase